MAIGAPGVAAKGELLSLPPVFSRVPDTTLDGMTTPLLEIRAATIRGLGHRAYGEPRQDAYAFDAGDGWFVAAVADGLGSLPHSQLASKTAANVLVALTASPAATGTQPKWTTVFGTVSDIVRRTVQTHLYGADPTRAAATTLTATCGLRSKNGTWQVSIASYGDCTAAKLTGNRWKVLANQEPGSIAEPTTVSSDSPELLNTATHALPSNTLDRLRIDSTELLPGEVLALFTDGIGWSFGGGRGEVGEQLAKWWASPPRLLEFAAQVGFMRQGEQDDRAAVVLWAAPPTTPGKPI
jgi:serine/threonine protein phosphatase PrpC